MEGRTRLAALRMLRGVGSGPEDRFDMIACAAAALAEAPMALLCFVDRDRQWFKARIGIDPAEAALAISFCTQAIGSRDALFAVHDAASDRRFRDYPVVTGRPNIRFYAGAVLRLPDGARVGTLCVLDDKPRELLSGRQQSGLIALAERASLLIGALGPMA